MLLRTLPTKEQTPIELRELVKISVDLLGQVIKQTLGAKPYQQIESIRSRLADLRDKDDATTQITLRLIFSQMKKMRKQEKHILARSFTLMLELMNVCENAYRSYRLSKHVQEKSTDSPNAIIYVLTAHPTEARSPENIAVFHMIQRQLIAILEKKQSLISIKPVLQHLIELSWRTSIVREQSPTVSDEAEHIYSTLLDRNILDSILEASVEIVPVYIRTWVGGDKDGHPGVNGKVMLESISLSRTHLIQYVHNHLNEVLLTLKTLKLKQMQSEIARLNFSLQKLRRVTKHDGLKIKKLRQQFKITFRKYKTEFGLLHPSLCQLQRLLHVFPGLVVPLELRESSDVLMSDPNEENRLTIDKMLKILATVSKGGDPRWYVRGLIVSMTSSFEHLQMADRKIRFAFRGQKKIPVIPLFEQAEALKRAPEIVRQWLKDPQMGSDIRKKWEHCEMMLGYSDSAKESGVLASRLEIADAMHRLDHLCQHEKVQPLFFQGSGGSVDRGGGSIQDQTIWWPHSALKIYKVTIQGEMVERSLASPEISRGQISRIHESASKSLAQPSKPPDFSSIQEFVNLVASEYKNIINNPEFLKLVEKATPYSDLSELRIGSRPTRRANRVSVDSLRAIPWVLCWTQTRVLFPTWWGIGSSWKKSDKNMKKALRKAFICEPTFSSYIRALGFTLAKVELSVWRIYLEHSGLDRKLTDRFFSLFQEEYAGALEMLQYVSEKSDPLWFNHWLGASIRLRSSMIHPLNLLQILAIHENDFLLLRLTVTGISSGMLTTG